MKPETTLLHTIPVLPSSDIKRDINWHEKYTGFSLNFSDGMYASLKRENIELHLQWHANTPDDPLLGGSVIKIFVNNIQWIFDEFVKRGTVTSDKLTTRTPWNTSEFGFYDPNNNAFFFVEDLE